MTNAILLPLLSLAAGFGAGTVFFGGLWLTVRRLDQLRNPGLVILLSSLARVALTLGVFWWVSQGGLSRIALCLAGFLTARILVTRAVRNPSGEEAPSCI